MKLVISKSNTSYYSEKSFKFFNSVKEKIPDLYHYGPNEMKWAVDPLSKLNQSLICPDLVYNGKIIEFNGDAFHANPLLYEDSSKPHPFNKTITAAEIRENDKNRYEYFNNLGFQVLVIWESEYNLHKSEALQKCIQFLTK